MLFIHFFRAFVLYRVKHEIKAKYMYSFNKSRPILKNKIELYKTIPVNTCYSDEEFYNSPIPSGEMQISTTAELYTIFWTYCNIQNNKAPSSLFLYLDLSTEEKKEIQTTPNKGIITNFSQRANCSEDFGFYDVRWLSIEENKEYGYDNNLRNMSEMMLYKVEWTGVGDRVVIATKANSVGDIKDTVAQAFEIEAHLSRHRYPLLLDYLLIGNEVGQCISLKERGVLY